MKTKPKLKPRRMWANYYGDFVACHDTRSAAKSEGDPSAACFAAPVAVIPLDDVDAIIARAAAAHYEAERSGRNERQPVTNGDCMRAALAAIGVLPKKGRK